MAYHVRKIIHWFHEYANRNLLPIIAVSMKSIKRKEFGLGILQNIRLKHSSRSMNLHINELACIHLISLGNLAYIAIEKLLVTTRGLWISFDVNRKGGALQFSVYFEWEFTARWQWAQLSHRLLFESLATAAVCIINIDLFSSDNMRSFGNTGNSLSEQHNKMA